MLKGELLTTGEVARLLDVSRQHVVNMCDRGEIPYVRIGAHRRIPASVIEHLTAHSLTYAQAKSLWLHRALLAELMSNPDWVISHARGNIDRWEVTQRRDGRAASYLERWKVLLNGDIEDLVDILVGRNDESCELRQNTPFAGVLSDETRRHVLRSFRTHWDAAA